MEERLTHIDENGRPRMVDVGAKADTKRIAVAKGSIYMHPETLKRIKEGSIAKGDVLSVAQTAASWRLKIRRPIFRCATISLSPRGHGFSAG